LCSFFGPPFLQSSPFFTLFAIIFCFYHCALSCIHQSQLFCIFRTQFLSSILMLLYSQGLFLFTIAQIAQHFQHSFPLWNYRWWLFVYCCIFNAILIILQLFLFDSCVVLFSKFLLFYKDLCVFVCACVPFHDEAIGNHYLCYSDESLSLILTLLCFCDIQTWISFHNKITHDNSLLILELLCFFWILNPNFTP
jgi:hypothetical protein